MTKIFRLIGFSAFFAAGLFARVASLDQAAELFSKGDLAGAVEIYRAILQQDSNSEQANLGLVQSLRKKDDVEDAYKSAEHALALLPQSAALHAAMGDVLFRMARIPEAEKEYGKAISLDPGNARAYLGAGNIQSFLFNRRTAAKLIKKAYECDPEDPDILFFYAYTLPDAEQIPILEKYLRLAVNDTREKRTWVSEHIEFYRNSGDLEKPGLKDPPETATIPLQAVWASPKVPVSGYRVKAIINGSKKVMLHLDTGASGVLIKPGIAEKLQLKRISAQSILGVGNSGMRQGCLAQAKSLQIGPLEFLHAILRVVDKGLPPDTDGIIGGDVFEQYLITLNFPKERLELRPLPMIDGKPFRDPETWKELDCTKRPELGSFSPIAKWDHLLVPTLVNNKKLGYFFLDTGAATNLISKEFAADITRLRAVGPVIKGLSGKTETFVASDVTLKMGRFMQQQQNIWSVSFKDLSYQEGMEIAGLIGHPMLQHFSITIDYRDGLVNFEYEGPSR